MSTSTHLAYIGIGANLGDARATVEYAVIDQFAAFSANTHGKTSSLFVTAPIDSSGDDCFNAVASIRTSLTPQDLPQQLQALEQLAAANVRIAMRRARSIWICCCTTRNRSRENLTVPHPAYA